jgi:hypothetical protein
MEDLPPEQDRNSLLQIVKEIRQ